ncbi:histidine kinase [Streptomyces sp. NPDC051582]|uniref:sensor histidine kinase n=1 Tax=Streptomyces sp. NPDC051582 TaxID=3155167 RepID=UPI00343D47DC
MCDSLLTDFTSDTASSVSLSVAATCSLFLRNTVPEVALLVTLSAYFLGCLNLTPLIALYYVAARRGPVVVGWAAAAVTAVVFGLAGSATGELSFAFSLDNLDASAPLECCTGPILAVVIGRSARSRWKQLKEAEARQELESRLLAEQVRVAERSSLAREMHDVVSHKVSLISLQAGALQVGQPDDKNVKDSAQLIHELAAQTVTELHHMLGVLRPAEDPAAAGHACGPGLAGLADLVRMSGGPVQLEMPEEWPDVPETVQRAAYRTVQEALTNIGKHAPGSTVKVDVTVTAASLRIEVRNGPPAGPARPPGMPGGGRGLSGLAERASLLGGEFTAEPGLDGGFAVEASYPLPQPDPRPGLRGH